MLPVCCKYLLVNICMHKPSTCNPQSNINYCNATAISRCTILSTCCSHASDVLANCYYCVIGMIMMRSPNSIGLLSICDIYTVPVLSICYRNAMASRNLSAIYYHFAVDLLSINYRYAIELLSINYGYALNVLSIN